MAPESLKSQIYSFKTDGSYREMLQFIDHMLVWSFGIVLSEILTRQDPYSEHVKLTNFQIATKVMQVLYSLSEFVLFESEGIRFKMD
jgi:hypothetical protein